MVAGVTPRAIRRPDGTRRNTWEQLDAQTAACVTLGSHQVPRWKHSHQVPRWHQALYLGAIRCISIDPSLALHHPTPSTLYSGVPRSSCGNRTQTWKPGNRCGNRCGNCWESVGNHGILIILKKRIPIPFLFFNIKNGFQHFSNSFHNGFHNGFQKFGGFHDSSRAQTECTPPSHTFSTSDETSRD